MGWLNDRRADRECAARGERNRTIEAGIRQVRNDNGWRQAGNGYGEFPGPVPAEAGNRLHELYRQLHASGDEDWYRESP